MLTMLCACSSGQSASAPEPQNDTEATAAAEETTTAAEKVQTGENVLDRELADNDRPVGPVPMIVTIPDGYNAYDTSGNYTEEMCVSQGVSYDDMQSYMQLAGYDVIIVPADGQMSDESLEIDEHVKDKDYGVDSLKALSAQDAEDFAQMLVASFNVSDYSIYEKEDARYVVFDCPLMNAERRYASIVNGKMVYFIAIPDSGVMSDAQDALVKDMLNSLVIG